MQAIQSIASIIRADRAIEASRTHVSNPITTPIVAISWTSTKPRSRHAIERPMRPCHGPGGTRSLIENPSGPESRIVGRLAPSPTGGLHLGHARTFLIAWLAARRCGGRVILRIEDLDSSRVRADALATALVDLRWLGLDWDEGPDVGGPSAPYVQSRAFVALRRRHSIGSKRARASIPARARGPTSSAPPAPRTPRTKGRPTPAPAPHRSAADARRAGRSPVRLAISRSRRARRLGRPLPGPCRARPITARGRFHRRSPRRRPFVSARRGGRRRRDGREPGHPRRRPGAQHSAADPALPPARLARARPSATSRWPSTPDGRRLAKRDGSLKLVDPPRSRRRSAPAGRLVDPFVRLVGIRRCDDAAGGDRSL